MARRAPPRGAGEGLLRPDAATQGRVGPRRHDRGAGRARRERTLPAMAQPLGRNSAHLPRCLLLRILAYRIQAASLGSLDKRHAARRSPTQGPEARFSSARPFEARTSITRDGANLGAGALLVREWNGKFERVMVLKGFAWNGETYISLSQIAKAMTGTSWNGHRLRLAHGRVQSIRDDGRLPRGFGVKRLMDLPMAWPDQWSALGLRAPAER